MQKGCDRGEHERRGIHGGSGGWINELIGKDKQLLFLTARCERQSGETRKRNDLTLLDRNSSIVLTGEVKLPYNKDGGSPLNAAVVRDARHIEGTLDGLLDFCSYEPALRLYKKLCRYYFHINPNATVKYVDAYRELWDSERV